MQNVCVWEKANVLLFPQRKTNQVNGYWQTGTQMKVLFIF